MRTTSIAWRLTFVAFVQLALAGLAIAWLAVDSQSSASYWTFVGTVVAPIVVIAAACFHLCVRRWLHRPVQTLIDQFARVSLGSWDLTQRLDVTRADELGAVAMHYDAFVARTQEVLLNASKLSEEADHAAAAAAKESRQLALSAVGNADTINDISKSLSEVNELSTTTARACKDAADVADRAQGAVARGNEEVDRLTEAMDGILDSSKAITKVVGVIQDIAFQMNMLAINAAVEAAKAGETGAGFGVVAEEVRKLAQMSADAATETGGLIDAAAERAAHGGGIAEEVALTLGQIQSETLQVGRLLSRASQEVTSQSESVDGVVNGIENLRGCTQTAAASAESLANASRDSSHKIDRLQQLVRTFKL